MGGCRVASVGGNQGLPHAQLSPMDPWQDTADLNSQAGGTFGNHIYERAKPLYGQRRREQKSEKQQRECRVLKPKFVIPNHTCIPVLGTSCWLERHLYNKAWLGCWGVSCPLPCTWKQTAKAFRQNENSWVISHTSAVYLLQFFWICTGERWKAIKCCLYVHYRYIIFQ